jgi:ABC-type amino acid transport substrate-binding protein
MSRVLVMLVLLAVAGCGLTVPSDPGGTLDRVTGGTLRVGAVDTGREPWVRWDDADQPSGVETDLARDFAKRLNARITWVRGSEQHLAEQLKHGRLDLLVGGFADTTPWMTHAGMTRPYTETKDPFGTKLKHVMLVPLGENAFLVELDRFLEKAEVRL